MLLGLSLLYVVYLYILKLELSFDDIISYVEAMVNMPIISLSSVTLTSQVKEQSFEMAFNDVSDFTKTHN